MKKWREWGKDLIGWLIKWERELGDGGNNTKGVGKDLGKYIV